MTVHRSTCERCASSLERPGDYCLVCRERNADGIVVDAAIDRATLTVLDGEAVVGETTIRTTPETGELRRVERRNFSGRIADEIRRKRPDEVYLAGDRDVSRTVAGKLRYECVRIDGEALVETAIDRRTDRALEAVDAPPEQKLGGSHSTLIGGRTGRQAVLAVAGHPHVKKVVPGPIERSGSSRVGVRAKVTRADENGNVRLLIRGGSSVQTNRVVTTAMNRELGERIRDDLDELLAETGVA